jgi:hypothetical protein
LRVAVVLDPTTGELAIPEIVPLSQWPTTAENERGTSE